MAPLREVVPVKQVAGEPRRRWFSADDMDLVVWLGDDDRPVSFQLCYDRLRNEHAVTWRAGSDVLDHRAVDDGERAGLRHKATPILVPDGQADIASIRDRFLALADALPADIVRLVSDRLVAPAGRA